MLCTPYQVYHKINRAWEIAPHSRKVLVATAFITYTIVLQTPLPKDPC